MKLTPRDLDIFTTLYEVQYLTIGQLTELYFPSESACRNRLLLLRRNGWLEEDRPRPFAAPNFSILKLGKTAFKHFGYCTSKKASLVYLDHRLELNDLYVKLRSKEVLKELKLDWQDGSNFVVPYLTTHIRPDARIIGREKKMIYVEYDRGTKNLPVVRRNLGTYLDWFDARTLGRETYPKIDLIYVTPKESRAKAIQRQFEILHLKHNRIPPENFEFYSFTTQAFLQQSKTILSL